ncbi:MAG: N-acetylmuramoyl-L-alanine amidase [Nitrospirae bacterium]|nr:N-acetylmuramoyl-L-alanine amidase [Nitrospirota bacterium]
MKVGKHANYVRIVFSAPEEYIQKASVILSGSNVIKVDFQSAVVIKAAQKGSGKVILKTDAPVEMTGGVKIVAKGSSCAFTVDNLDDIDVSKLSSPSRLVIDAYIGKPSSGYPFQEAADIAFESFAIDAGHGGYDTGMKGRNFTEKETTLSIAKELANTLGKKGKKVFLTRKGDQTLTIKERIKAVNLRSSEVFISIHVSSRNELSIYTSSKVKGQKGRTEGIQEALEQTSKTSASAEIDKNVADAAAQAIKSEIGINVRHERLPLPIIAHVNAPAVLIELPNPEKFNYDRKNRERLINALLKVIGYSARGKE